jgi:hypothetical protein
MGRQMEYVNHYKTSRKVRKMAPQKDLRMIRNYLNPMTKY